MVVVLGSCKGETFVVGVTSSRRKAEKWVVDHPHGLSDEYDYVEIQVGHNL